MSSFQYAQLARPDLPRRAFTSSTSAADRLAQVGPPSSAESSPASTTTTLVDEEEDIPFTTKVLSGEEDSHVPLIFEIKPESTRTTKRPFTLSMTPREFIPSSRLDLPESPTTPRFNPKAQPFIPSISHAPSAIPYNPCPSISDLEPSWFPAFLAGTTSSTVTIRDMDKHAYTLVMSTNRIWGTDTFIELARYFCWHGYMDQRTIRCGDVARFARAVYNRFEANRGAWYANEFLWHLREGLMETFDITWSSLDDIHSEETAPALALAKFTGDLFAQDLLLPDHLHACLTLLLAPPSPSPVTIDNILAIQILLVHALSTPDKELETALWAEGRGPSFCEAYAERAREVSLGMEGTPVEMDQWVKSVLRLIGRFASVQRMRCNTMPSSLISGMDSEGRPVLKLGNGVFTV